MSETAAQSLPDRSVGYRRAVLASMFASIVAPNVVSMSLFAGGPSIPTWVVYVAFAALTAAFVALDYRTLAERGTDWPASVFAYAGPVLLVSVFGFVYLWRRGRFVE